MLKRFKFKLVLYTLHSECRCIIVTMGQIYKRAIRVRLINSVGTAENTIIISTGEREMPDLRSETGDNAAADDDEASSSGSLRKLSITDVPKSSEAEQSASVFRPFTSDQAEKEFYKGYTHVATDSDGIKYYSDTLRGGCGYGVEDVFADVRRRCIDWKIGSQKSLEDKDWVCRDPEVKCAICGRNHYHSSCAYRASCPLDAHIISSDHKIVCGCGRDVVNGACSNSCSCRPGTPGKVVNKVFIMPTFGKSYLPPQGLTFD